MTIVKQSGITQSRADSRYLKLDQTTPQSVINGVPYIVNGIKTPKIYPNADSTTSFQINKADGTTNVLNVDTTNRRVGIGTTAPVYALDVVGVIRTTGGIRTATQGIISGAGNFYALAGATAGAPSYAFNNDANTGIWSPTADTIAFANGGSEKVRIDSSGNVGIGTTNPLWQLTVENAGTAEMKFRTTGTGHATFGFSSAGSTNTITAENAAGTGRLLFKMAAGTNSILDLQNKSVRVGWDNYLDTGTFSVFDNTPTSGITHALFKEGAGQSTNEVFGVYANDGTTPRLVIKSGNVGIGTTNPLQKLDVSGWIKLTGTLEFSSGAKYTGGNIYSVTNDLSFSSYNGSAVVENMRIKANNGNVGIGTTNPTAVLTLKAGTATAGTAPLKLTTGTLLTTPENGAIEFANNRVYITNKSLQKAIDRTSDVKLTTTTVAETTTETTVFTASVPIGSWVAGNILKMKMYGSITNTVAQKDQVTIKVKVGGTEVASIQSTDRQLTDECWVIDGISTIRTVGASGEMAFVLTGKINGQDRDFTCDVASIDTTGTLDITVTATWDNATAGDNLTCIGGFMEYKN